MSVALNPSRRKRPASPRHVSPRSSDPRRVSLFSPDRQVQRLPAQASVPAWVRSLLWVQQASVVATFGLAGSVLAVYGWTVYSQQVWGKEYQQLETLRRHERQLTTNKEMLKDQIAKQGNRPGSTLVPQSPDRLIFLRPAPSRGDAPTPLTPPQASPIAPLGY
ncbi:hypothetical protein [Myxacorys almedinensis]|uniref:Cell division protein FtsL n=1 Tax=Myxacorys almedinensis A TaxID=2690445 RepID=A0A8J7ZCS2_9CYAN|nr:hypothetical protein [Myxacorys almedinensis]NDJ19620.1 hypothetical protein [Myxacorys almedinensis A]